MDTVKFITLTNNGYIDYTLNCLKSLELIDFQKSLYCYTLGKESHNILQKNGYKSILLNSNIDDTEFNSYRQGNWHHITKRKFEIIHKELKNNKFVCFTDGDIVFLNKNFMNYCLSYIQENDIIIQNDLLLNNDQSYVCSGFMFIKSNKKMLDLFNPENVKKYVKPDWDDQVYINQIKSKLKYKTLPLNLFPNGKYYYQSEKNKNMINFYFCKETEKNKKNLFPNGIYYHFKKELQPMMIHFNWVIGHEKKNKMIQHNKWYL